MPKKTKEHRVMGEFKRGTLHSGSKTGPKVKSRKQAIAIAMSAEASAVTEGIEATEAIAHATATGAAATIPMKSKTQARSN